MGPLALWALPCPVARPSDGRTMKPGGVTDELTQRHLASANMLGPLAPSLGLLQWSASKDGVVPRRWPRSSHSLRPSPWHVEEVVDGVPPYGGSRRKGGDTKGDGLEEVEAQVGRTHGVGNWT